jgi:hypothetical protein
MMRPRPETVVAIVNGLIVWLGPLLFIWWKSADPNTSVTVYPPGVLTTTSELWAVAHRQLILLPFAIVAAWRSRVYARRVMADLGEGWGGVFEAGVLGAGFLIAMSFTRPSALLSAPLQAFQMLAALALYASIAGLLIGLILFVTGRTTLWIMNLATGTPPANASSIISRGPR